MKNVFIVSLIALGLLSACGPQGPAPEKNPYDNSANEITLDD